MPDSVITKVERLGRANATPNMFDFLDRNGVLFEWNEDVDKAPENIVEEDVVLYPSLPGELPGVALERDQPIPSIEDNIEPHSQAERKAAINANLEPFNVTGVDTPTIIQANANEIDGADDDDDGIISIATIPAGQNDPHPHILHNSSDDEQVEEDDEDDDDDDDNNNNDNDDEEEDAAYDNANKGTAVVEDQEEE
jgi:hypothetical protein